MKNKKITFTPFFDAISSCQEALLSPSQADLPDYRHALMFLNSYSGQASTFNTYRREVERLFQWLTHIHPKTLPGLHRQDIEQYLEFCQHPPEHWIATQIHPRFIEVEGERRPNPDWRPFVVRAKKSERHLAKTISAKDFKWSNSAIKDLFSVLGTFFNYLISEGYLSNNPVALIKQKSRFIRKQQDFKPIRRLNQRQWETILAVVDDLILEDPRHERTRFMFSCLYLLYLRISELGATARWTPTMNDFFQDDEGYWWFQTVGKGHKLRRIAVSDDMLFAFRRWRSHLQLVPLPSPSDDTPLFPKSRGKGALSDLSWIREMIQQVFDEAQQRLHQAGAEEDALHLSSATVHWLRHTGISEDVKHRPREHVRDDAGHSSSLTTDRYINVELKARHQSAQKKTLLPKKD